MSQNLPCLIKNTHSTVADIVRTENFYIKLDAMTLQPVTMADPLPEMTFDLQGQLLAFMLLIKSQYSF